MGSKVDRFNLGLRQGAERRTGASVDITAEGQKGNGLNA